MGPSPATTPSPSARPPQRRPDAPPPGAVLGPHYARCFGCGDAQPGGLQLAVTVEDGVAISAKFVVGPQHEGAPGLAHGGVLAAAFDEAIGALLWLLGAAGVTARLETDFRRPVPVGSTLHIAAVCTGVDGRKVYSRAEGRLDAPDGPLALTAAALFLQVPAEHFLTHGKGLPVDAELVRSVNP